MPEHEGPRMAKRQRTFYLHPDLDRLLTAEEERTGVSLSRIASAALMRYLFSDLLGFDNTMWMALAVATEKGNCEMADVPTKAFESCMKMAVDDLQTAKARGDEYEQAIAKHKADEASYALRAWKHRSGTNPDDPIQGFIDYNSRIRKQVRSHVLDELRLSLDKAKARGDAPERIADLERQIKETEANDF